MTKRTCQISGCTGNDQGSGPYTTRECQTIELALRELQIHIDTFHENKTRRSQKLTPRQPKGNRIRGFKVKTSTQKLKSQYVSSAKQSKN